MAGEPELNGRQHGDDQCRYDRDERDGYLSRFAAERVEAGHAPKLGRTESRVGQRSCQPARRNVPEDFPCTTLNLTPSDQTELASRQVLKISHTEPTRKASQAIVPIPVASSSSVPTTIRAITPSAL